MKRMRLKCSLLVVLFLVFGPHLLSQNNNSYLDYYQLINKAEILKNENNERKSLETYLTAFSKFDGFEGDYTEAIKLALKQENSEITFKLLKEKAIKTGWFADEELFDKVLLNKFFQTKLGIEYLKNKEDWFTQNRLNLDYKVVYLNNIIDATDQFVRSGFLSSSKNNFINDSLYFLTRVNVMEETDNKNFIQFKGFVNRNGFPGRSKFAGKSPLTTFIIHVFKYKNSIEKNCSVFEKEKFKYLDSIIKQQILIGEFSRDNYAYCYDYSLHADSITYFAYPRFTFNNGKREYINYAAIDPKNLNKRREEIGLMTIEEQCKILEVPLPPNY